MKLDISQARASRPYSRAEYLARAAWTLASPLFRFSPRPCFGWRRWLLRRFGARVGAGAHVYPGAVITIPWNLELGAEASVADEALIYSLGPVSIGARATISHRAHLCAGTHDYEDPALPLRREPIRIGADAWICAQALVGPGVTVGEGAVVGAGAVAMEDVPAWRVVNGNPAKVVKERKLRAQ